MNTDSVFLYGEINLPTIPEELLSSIDQLTVTIDNADIGYGLTHVKDGRTLVNCKFNHSVTTDNQLISWLSKRVPGAKQLEKVSIQEQSPGTHIVHSDIRRALALNYMISTGGDNVINNWYQEKNMPLRRSKIIKGRQADTGAVKYEDLELLDSTKLEKNKWYLIATDILHDVDFITSTRKSVSISFDNYSILQMLQKFNLIKDHND